MGFRKGKQFTKKGRLAQTDGNKMPRAKDEPLILHPEEKKTFC